MRRPIPDSPHASDVRTFPRRRVCALLLLAACLASSGCEMFQWMRPHQLWKLNRQPAISRDDAYFSIPPRPVPASEGETGGSLAD